MIYYKWSIVSSSHSFVVQKAIAANKANVSDKYFSGAPVILVAAMYNNLSVTALDLAKYPSPTRNRTVLGRHVFRIDCIIISYFST